MKYSKKLAVVKEKCVGCGNCMRYCRLEAISVYKGVFAEVDIQKCVGCGKCVDACPAGVIELTEREGQKG